MNNAKKLTSQWYNALVQSCGLDSQTFQLVRGVLPVGITSTIWKIIDAIPPESINRIDDEFGFFSTHYGSVINNLLPQDSSDSSMRDLLGDNYVSWANYKIPPDPIPYQSSQTHDIDRSNAKKIQFTDWCLKNGQSKAKIQAGIDLISEMQKLEDQQMAQLLGDDYPRWETYTNQPSQLPPPPPNNSLIDISLYKQAQFSDWALDNGQSKETIVAGITILSQVDLITAAVQKWQAASAAKKEFAYTPTAQGLQDAIARGQAKTVSLDSKTQSSDTSNSWASGKVLGEYGFFSASVSASWGDKFWQDIQQQGVQLNVAFEKVATLIGSPLSTPNTLDSDLSKYQPWYDSKVIQMAYTQNNNNVWKHTPPTWESMFGPNGNLKNLTVALIIVDGITSTMTITASVLEDKQEEFKAAARGGYWPFFSTAGQGGWLTEVNFNDDGTFLTITSASKAGNPKVLGVLVSPFDHAFKG